MIYTNPSAIQHSSLLTAYIIEQIKAQDGQITFEQYMHHALYAPSLGYYNAGSIKFGAGGDFITAPELGSLFAQCLAKQCMQILGPLNKRNILEIGAGSGKLACDLLQELQKNNLHITNYYILELSADLRNRQQDLIFKTCPQFAPLVHWLDHLPSTPLDGVIIANEVVDAMPISRFYLANDLLQEYYVTFTGSNFATKIANATIKLKNAFEATNLAAFISQPYTSEINLWIQAWISSLNACLNQGAILLCDYGFPRAEYYHPQRNSGTLMCHFQHRSHDNPFIHIGLQDITAHVDFTAIAEAASNCNLEVAGYTNLASFLLNCGITKFLKPGDIKQVQELQTLSSPSEMGELFKVIALTKDITTELLGFTHFDKLHTL